MIKQLQTKETSFSQIWEGKKISFKTGKIAPQSDGAVMIEFGEIAMLVTAVMNTKPNENSDFMPLTIDYRESYYAGGKIGGGQYQKREGRPSDSAILISRLTDRPIRPMFPEGMVNDVVVTISPFSVDRENNPGVFSIIGASLAIMLAGIPFEGPVGAVRIGYKDGNFIVNPTYDQIDSGMLDLVIAGSEDTITMVECGANEIPTDILMQAFEVAQKEIKRICQWQKEFIKNIEIAQKEIVTNKPSEDLVDFIKNFINDETTKNMFPSDKKKFYEVYGELEKQVLEAAKDKIEDSDNKDFTESKIKIGVFKTIKKIVRKNILENKKRVDGRGLDEIRPLYCEVGLYPRVHGIGLFQRGETQVISFTTLGAPGDVLMIDTMEHDDFEKRFMHHYNMPPFSTNEARSTRGAGRREIGHGRLAERAIETVIPKEEQFPYTIRTVSEVMSCNGSTSMASVCASTLSLMDAGVPITAPVSGIAMGLVTDEKLNYEVLTDIQGIEDFTGDMDFKVAGTTKGINALQMDMKIPGLKLEIIREAIERANVGRASILEFMLQTLSQPREEINPNAPKIVQYKVNPAQVRDVIGPGGATINEIIKQSGVKIDFKEDGTCLITAKNTEAANIALSMIKDIVWMPTAGDVVDGTITRVEAYGVFVTFGKNKSGLCHVKNLGMDGFVADPKPFFKEGDKMRVRIMSIDSDGKIQLKREV